MEYKIGMGLNITLVGILMFIGVILGAMTLFTTIFGLFLVYVMGKFVKIDCTSNSFKILLILLSLIVVF